MNFCFSFVFDAEEQCSSSTFQDIAALASLFSRISGIGDGTGTGPDRPGQEVGPDAVAKTRRLARETSGTLTPLCTV